MQRRRGHSRASAPESPALWPAPAAPIPEPPAPDNDAEMVEGDPVVGEVESEGEAMEGLPSDADPADACEDDDLEDFGAFAARGFVPKSFNLPPDEPHLQHPINQLVRVVDR